MRMEISRANEDKDKGLDVNFYKTGQAGILWDSILKNESPVWLHLKESKGSNR